jgi:hypothetical protein
VCCGFGGWYYGYFGSNIGFLGGGFRNFLMWL